ncbi:TonB-dependent receptor domain-containing protein [Kineobactrum salinum]|uniref:TonB-dependent receptor domain-containing protein n=1 Tax=Kineobactrum salinum TaxID=2708301 RepID=UPI0022B29CA2|nr:TonB-dependent receptor [Kineobactrum salinum]
MPANPDLAEFEGERAITFEVGAKLRPAAQLSVDFALYNTTVDDFQYNTNTPLGNSIANVEVRSRGVDASFNWLPTSDLRIEGGVVYADARIREAFPNVSADTRVQRAPEWTGNLGAYYDKELTDGLSLRVNPSLEFSSRQLNQLPFVNAPDRAGHGLVNLRVAVGATDETWELALIGKNLTDQRPLLTATQTLLLAGPFYGSLHQPTTYALQLSVKY